MLRDIKKNIGEENITSKLHVSKIKLVKDEKVKAFTYYLE